MSQTERESAFLYDLYVAPDWGERFAELMTEHLGVPEKGQLLYVGAATGGHAVLWHERSEGKLTITAVDESAERLNIARAKAAAVKGGAAINFQATPRLETLDFPDDTFTMVVGDASLVEPERLPEVFAEMVRVAAPGATVALNAVSASSFGEFFSIYWEALHNADSDEQALEVETLITELPTISQIEETAADAGVEGVESWTSKEEFHFATGEEFLQSPLIAQFLLGRWMTALPDDDEDLRARVRAQIAALIDEERAGLDFALSIKATLVAGRKARVS